MDVVVYFSNDLRSFSRSNPGASGSVTTVGKEHGRGGKRSARRKREEASVSKVLKRDLDPVW